MSLSTTSKIAAVIPARYASSRLPGKVLADIAGKAMVHHVVERALSLGLFSTVIVATDDQRVMEYCSKYNIIAKLTKDNHVSGTDRVAEVAESLDVDYVVNIQADEPLISMKSLKMLAEILVNKGVRVGTLCHPILDPISVHDPNIVKVVRDDQDKALYFSRQAIPAVRDTPYKRWHEQQNYYQHVGLYGYDRDTLLELVQLPPSQLELSESLEQLRWLQAGYAIHVAEVADHSLGVDTADDLALVRKMIAK